MRWLMKLFVGGTDTERVMEHAIFLAQSGHPVEAVSQMRAAVDAVERQRGWRSCEHARGLFNLAMLHMATGDVAAAADDCRRAADCCPRNAAGRKDRLMYLMNAGQLLGRAGKIQTARDVLETSLEERVSTYGPDHVGTAYGQQAFAEVLMASGHFHEGLDLAERAARTFADHRHHELPNALATVTALASASGRDEQSVWSYAATVGEELVPAMIDSAVLLAEAMPSATGLRYLQQLFRWASFRLPSNSPPLMELLATWSKLAVERRDHEHQRMAVEQSVRTARHMDDPRLLVDALAGYARWLAEHSVHDQDVREAYRKALAHANEHGFEFDAAETVRCWALFEARRGDAELAEQRFQHAIELARNSGNSELLSRSQIAMGVFLQHQHRNDEAAPLLQAGVDRLEITHPDAVCAIVHQVAQRENLGCPCHAAASNSAETLNELARHYFRRIGLGDILISVTFERDELGGGETPVHGFRLQLSREPSGEELRRIHVAENVFRRLVSGAA